MKSTGMIRHVDGPGRIVLPKELRKSLNIEKDTPMEIFVDGTDIILRKYKPIGSCDFCSEITPDPIHFEGICICRSCRDKLNAL